MDSITQLTAGAALGEAVLGPKVGRKALLWGAILGTLPDLDVFIPMGGPVNDFVYHRGFSHSLFLLAALSPLMAWLITKIHPGTKRYFKKWLLLSFIVLETSVLLDYLTIYGTQIFWPFSSTPLAWPVFFIVDPLLTFPLLVGTIAALIMTRKSTVGHKINTACLALSFVYLLWATGVKYHMDCTVKEKLRQQGISYTQPISSPAPFTTFLHRYLGISGDRYFETYASIFDGDAPLRVNFYPRNTAFVQGLESHPPVQKLMWFTRGYFAMSSDGKAVVMTDLRMGSEPHYVFRFKVAQKEGSILKPADAEKLSFNRDLSQLKWVWQRIWVPLSIPSDSQ
jgi:inner membrane protein